jgi:hypothetical protein
VAALGCPATPLSLLSGPWTFNSQTIAANDFARLNWSWTGRFVASTSVDRGGNAIGVLDITATSLLTNNGGADNATRQERNVGRFQIFDDCTGGTLTFNLGSRPMQYDFWFYDNRQSIRMISTTPGFGAAGSAHVGVAGCPVGVTDPLSLLSGVYSAKIQALPNFSLEAYGLVGLVGAQVGRDRANNPIGQLAILATSSVGNEGSIVRLESDAGLYSVDADCTGGVLNFNISSRPTEYHFYFRAGFQTMDVLSLKGPSAYGVLSRY